MKLKEEETVNENFGIVCTRKLSEIQKNVLPLKYHARKYSSPPFLKQLNQKTFEDLYQEQDIIGEV